MRGWWLLALAGCGTVDVFDPDHAPVVELVQASTGEVFVGAHTWKAQVSDPDDDPDQVLVVFDLSTDGETFLPIEPGVGCADFADAEGRAQCTLVMAEAHSLLRVRALDIRGYEGRVELPLTVGEDVGPVLTVGVPDALAYPGVPFELTGEVSDPDDDVADLTLTWWTDLGQEPSGQVFPAADGALAWDVVLPDEGTVDVHVRATDPLGHSRQVTVPVYVGPENRPPGCTWDAAPPEAWPVGAPLTVSLWAVDEREAGDGLWVQALSDVEGLLAEGPAPGQWFEATLEDLSAADHALTLRVEDPAGGLCELQADVHIGAPPTVSLLAPTDGVSLTQGEGLTVQWTVDDPDGDAADLDLTLSSSTQGSLWTGDGLTGSVMLTSLQTGGHVLTLSVRDPRGLSASDDVTVTVTAP